MLTIILVNTFNVGHRNDVNIIWAILVFCLAWCILDEATQLARIRVGYFTSHENWLEITLFVIISILLFMGDYCDHVSTKRLLSAFAIVLSWYRVVIKVGQHPALANYNVFVTMFYKVLTIN